MTLELKTPAGRRQQDESVHNETETELDGLKCAPVRNDILVSDFPDYVREIAEECGENSKLANEYFVSVFLVKIHQNHNFFLYLAASSAHKYRNLPCGFSST